MADKAIGELVPASQVQATDLFVLEQSGIAKKLTGQVLENWLLSYADGHGGIQNIEKVRTIGLADTYRITYADASTYDFVVTNGAKGDQGVQAHVWIKYASQEPSQQSHSMGDKPDNWIGIYSGTASSAPTDYTQYKWFNYKGTKGDTGSPAQLLSREVVYHVSTSSTIPPSGSWQTNVPSVPAGQYLWTRITLNFNTGLPVEYYSVAKTGIDGAGSVATVNNQGPDGNGNVTINAEHILTDSNRTVQYEIDNAVTSSKISSALGYTPVNPANALTLEEIDASTTLIGKIASAQAVKLEVVISDSTVKLRRDGHSYSMEMTNCSPSRAVQILTQYGPQDVTCGYQVTVNAPSGYYMGSLSVYGVVYFTPSPTTAGDDCAINCSISWIA